MIKNLLFIILFCTTASVAAQSEGNVGINTTAPTATLHVKSKGLSTTTQTLKVENDAGTDLLTINNDGTVSGLAAVNLSSGTPSTPKASGIFSGMTPNSSTGYLSPVGNAFSAAADILNSPAFFTVAKAVPLNGVLDQMVLTVRSEYFYFLPQPIRAELYVNGVYTGVSISIYDNVLDPATTYTSTFTGVSFPVNRGDLFAYRISGFPASSIYTYVSSRYTEQ